MPKELNNLRLQHDPVSDRVKAFFPQGWRTKWYQNPDNVDVTDQIVELIDGPFWRSTLRASDGTVYEVSIRRVSSLKNTQA